MCIRDRYGVSRSALSRHKTNHLPRLVQAAEVAEAAQAVTSGAALIDELDRLLNRALAILEAAEGSGQLKVALQAIREARECIKTCADLAVTAELEKRVEELEVLIEQREDVYKRQDMGSPGYHSSPYKRFSATRRGREAGGPYAR